MELELNRLADPAAFPVEVQTLVAFHCSFTRCETVHDPLLRAGDIPIRINASLDVVHGVYSDTRVCGSILPTARPESSISAVE